jgi:hypothetical protein
MVSPALVYLNLSQNALSGFESGDAWDTPSLRTLDLGANSVQGGRPGGETWQPAACGAAVIGVSKSGGGEGGWRVEGRYMRRMSKPRLRLSCRTVPTLNGSNTQRRRGAVLPPKAHKLLAQYTRPLPPAVRLAGSLPARLAQQPLLSYIDLSWNNFTGTLDEFAADLAPTTLVGARASAGAAPQALPRQCWPACTGAFSRRRARLPRAALRL